MSAPPPPVQVGLVGCGRWGRHILRDLKRLGCAVHVVARSPESAARARDGGADGVVGRVGDLPRVDGAVVATPTTAHAAVVEQLLEGGVSVYCEKPLTASAVEVRRLVARGGERLFVMDKWRYHPGVEALAAIARAGELGRVVGVRSTRVGRAERPLDVDAVWHLVPHDLAIGLHVLGTLPAPRAAVAETEHGATQGMIAVLGTRPWLVVEVSGRRRRHFREVRLVCEEGAAVLADSYAESLCVYRAAPGAAPPPVELRPLAQELPLLRELRAFVEHLRGGPPPLSPASDALLAIETIGALRTLAGLAPDAPR